MTKYHAKKTPCHHGHTHDSGMEAKRCNDLHALENAGSISLLQQQPEFPVVVNGKKICVYKGDFSYFVGDERVIVDVKGVVTPIFSLKKKLVEALYPGIKITLYPPKKRKVCK